jgi:hypothetical protein
MKTPLLAAYEHQASGKGRMMEREPRWRGVGIRRIRAARGFPPRQSDNAIGWFARGPIWHRRPGRSRWSGDNGARHPTENQFREAFPWPSPSDRSSWKQQEQTVFYIRGGPSGPSQDK